MLRSEFFPKNQKSKSELFLLARHTHLAHSATQLLCCKRAPKLLTHAKLDVSDASPSAFKAHFYKFKDFSEVKEIEDIKFKVSNLELSLVESCVLSDINEPLNIKLINKILKKYKNNFGIEIFYKIWEYKYIMSFNRLKELSKKIDEWLYTVFLDIVKRNWWLFIWEWLRGF